MMGVVIDTRTLVELMKQAAKDLPTFFTPPIPKPPVKFKQGDSIVLVIDTKDGNKYNRTGWVTEVFIARPEKSYDTDHTVMEWMYVVRWEEKAIEVLSAHYVDNNLAYKIVIPPDE